MPQKVVPLITDEIYHVFNRGVDKRDIFLNKDDYVRFYQTLTLFNNIEPTTNFKLAQSNSTQKKGSLVEIHAYALLPNHFHLLIRQKVDGGISEFMRRISTGYTSYFNQKFNRNGSLFQGRFKRVHIEDDTLYKYIFAYVNENHFVHKSSINREVCHTSSLHYQKKSKSRAIGNEEVDYNFVESKKLAQDIYKKRKDLKSVATLE